MKYVNVSFRVDRETEKAVYVEVYASWTFTTYKWLPKSACKFEEYVSTVDAFDRPKTYGKRVVAIAAWLDKKIREYYR